MLDRYSASDNDKLQMAAHKTFIVKRKLAKAQKQNRPLPQWVRMQTGNKVSVTSYFLYNWLTCVSVRHAPPTAQIGARMEGSRSASA